MRRTIIVLTLLLCAVSASATTPNPTARQRELIKEILTLTNMNRAATTMVDAMFAEMQKQLEASATPDDAAETKEVFENFRARAAKLDFESLAGDAFIDIFAKYFDEKELEDLVAFHSSPTGRKSIEVMPDLMREAMEVGTETVAPKIEEAMQQAREDFEKKRPWRRTMSDLRSIASALELYAEEHDRYPAGDYASLAETLEDDTLPEHDIWGTAYAYAVSTDGKSYRLVSAGGDGIFDWDSRRVAARKEADAEQPIRYRDRPEDDLILENGAFVQLPIQAKPKEN